MKKPLLVAAVLLLAAIPVWMFGIAPNFLKIPRDFSFYEAEIFSVDNFYDAAAGEFGGDQISITEFSYKVTGERDGILEIQNLFDVKTPSGDPIFVVERLYGIDPSTGAHTVGYGDKERDGYLFGPHGLKKDQPFTYWHINYDAPAHLTFVDEESILGLPVYRYESRYDGMDIDQTEQLTHLPGVGVTRGVNLDPYLQVWIEPTTGRMIKYEDDTIAYYYDLATGQRIHPWNKFNNRYTQSSIAEQVRVARAQIKKQTLLNSYVPAGLGMIAAVLLLGAYGRRNKKNIIHAE